MTFASDFEKLTGYPPFPWQERLYREYFAKGSIPKACSIPTGLGKTSVIAVWLIAIASKACISRRLIYVVNRRTVVDQTTDEVEKYQRAIDKSPELQHLKSVFGLLPISTLRGQFADNGEWCEDPSRPAVICGTVDMIGSRLLFSGYGIGRAKRPVHAGFLGQDALLIHDEAHLEPAFQSLIESIEHEQSENEPTVPWPKFRVMELTATSKAATPFQLDGKDYADATVTQRITSAKNLHLHELVDGKKPQKELAERALQFKGSGKAILIFASGVEAVLEIAATLDKARLSVKTLTGTMRGKERDGLITDATFARFMPKPAENAATGTVYLVSPPRWAVRAACCCHGLMRCSAEDRNLPKNLAWQLAQNETLASLNLMPELPTFESIVVAENPAAPSAVSSTDKMRRPKRPPLRSTRPPSAPTTAATLSAHAKSAPARS